MFAAVLLGPAALVGGALAVRQDTTALQDELLREAEAALAASHPRPAHAEPPSPGTFGDAVAKHLPAIASLKRDAEADREALRAVADGSAAGSSLSPSARAAVDRADPALDGLLAGTRAPLADLPAARESYVPVDGTTWADVRFAAELAAIRIRRRLVEGAPDAAASTCLDALALARDAGIAGGLVGRMSGAAIVTRLAPACAAALAAIEPSSTPTVLAQLRTLRDALPSDAEMLRVEFLSSSLFIYAPLLDGAARSRLGPRALAILKDGDRATRAWERIVLRASWPALRRHRANLVEAAASPHAERSAALEAAAKKAQHWMNPMVHLEPSYLRYVHRAEAATRRLDGLAYGLAARIHRARKGTWPADCEALRAVGLVTPDELTRSCSTARFESAGEDGLRVVVPLPQADPEKDEAEYLVRLDGS